MATRQDVLVLRDPLDSSMYRWGAEVLGFSHTCSVSGGTQRVFPGLELVEEVRECHFCGRRVYDGIGVCRGCGGTWFVRRG
jgi:hypothetical protein